MILFIDKPVGITSFDVIRLLRKQRGIRKMGHAGTLDPRASGLMIIATGDDTKKLTYFLKLPKVYETEVLVGESRDTGDLEGTIIEEVAVPVLEERNVKEVVESMTGVLALPVPKYSAIKKDGKPLYAYAREGKEVDIPIKKMEVRDAVYKGMKREGDRVLVDIVFDVGSGTYIRSLAEEVGRRLGYPATVKSLRRISIGDYRVEDAEKIKE